MGASNCKLYGVFNGKVWSLTDLAQRVKVNDLLRLRSRDVSICINIDADLPVSSVLHGHKRQASSELDAPTNNRPRTISEYEPIVPIS